MRLFIIIFSLLYGSLTLCSASSAAQAQKKYTFQQYLISDEKLVIVTRKLTHNKKQYFIQENVVYPSIAGGNGLLPNPTEIDDTNVPSNRKTKMRNFMLAAKVAVDGGMMIGEPFLCWNQETLGYGISDVTRDFDTNDLIEKRGICGKVQK